jgi:hypothetical protein
MLTAVVIVPLVWYWYVMPPERAYIRRAALAGATCTFLITTLSYAMFSVWLAVSQRPSRDGLGDLVGAVGDLFIIGKAWVVDAPLGAVIGILLALIERHWLGKSPHAPASEVSESGKPLSASMLAILASPLVAFLFALLQSVFGRFIPQGMVGFAVLLAGAWLVTIPIAAALGRSRARATVR